MWHPLLQIGIANANLRRIMAFRGEKRNMTNDVSTITLQIGIANASLRRIMAFEGEKSKATAQVAPYCRWAYD